MADVEAGKTAEPVVHTYHCICTQLILATTSKLDTLQTRSSDKSFICPLPAPGTSSHNATLVDTAVDSKATVVRLEDGFEKRYFEKCLRCDLIVGYHLDRSQFDESKDQAGKRDDVVYLLPGGLMTTDEMHAGKKMDQEIERIAIST